MTIERVKVVFPLERDDDDYPPQDSEALWAKPLDDGHYELDNVPFFIRGVSCGDIVSASEADGELRFARVVAHSGNSTLRVIVLDLADVPTLRAKLETHGCATELSHIAGLVSVHVPGSGHLDDVVAFLKGEESAGRLEYEEACVY